MEKQVSMKKSSTQNALSKEIAVSKSDLQRKEEAHERRKQRQREYYWKNRDKIQAWQKEYYAAKDKAELASQMRKYRQKNKERVSAQRKEYRAKNIEMFKEYEKKYRQKHREKRLERGREYWYANRDVLLAKKREYYEKNKYRMCSYSLNHYCLKSIEQIGASCPDKVNNYLKLYPFEEYAELAIKKALRINGIYSSHGMYDDCYEAGMLAYLYSIHRCASMQYSHVQAYIKKMIRVYIVCAIVVYNETKNICRINGMREICLDAESSACRY